MAPGRAQGEGPSRNKWYSGPRRAQRQDTEGGETQGSREREGVLGASVTSSQGNSSAAALVTAPALTVPHLVAHVRLEARVFI